MSRKMVGVQTKVWERLRNLAYDNRMSIPAFIVKLMDNWEGK